jgi:type IV secretory pathway TrbD component
MLNPQPAYRRAATRPLALAVLLAAFVAGALIVWWLLPLGLLAYAAMVALAARDPHLIAVAQRPARPKLTSATFRAYLDSIERTHQEIARSVAQADGPLGRLLGPIGVQARELTEESYVLCQKGEIIESYLAAIDQRDLRARLQAAEQRLAQTHDPYTRQQLEETRQALLDKQQNARDLGVYIDRIVAQLQNISASLDNVLAETVRLRTADAATADSTTSQVARRLSDLKADMDAFQQVLDTALTQTSPA